MTPPHRSDPSNPAGAPDAALGGDPRQIREDLLRCCELASQHGIGSVVVGLAGSPEDIMTPDLLAYVESALRVEDSIFRMTRERAVLFLVDVDRAQAERIIGRLAGVFAERFPSLRPPRVDAGFYEVRPGSPELAVRDVLPAIFPPSGPVTH